MTKANHVMGFSHTFSHACRKERKELKTGVDSESQIAEGNAGSFSATSSVAPTDPNVEMLLSQLHDLSFMLEDNLSIPQKVEGTDSIL